MFRIDRDRALIAVEHREVEAVFPLHIAQLRARDIADTRSLDLDNVGAHVAEQLRAGRPRLHVREIEDAHAGQRLTVLPEGLGREPRQTILLAV